ncbi:class I SAM-dependent methyltransferase [Streptomyces sp. NPDC127037]|uniref:class I SAM-dependent methyltransferase n=1 Tax=Streptomyces sp. NPDC127037 TaxID=3347113 RepID=UPI00365D6785
MQHERVRAGSAPYRAPGGVFAGTASFYASARPGYPAELIDHCVRFAAAFPGRRVLDLATGAGAVAIALAERGVDVLAVDPCAEMLDEARRAAARRNVANVEWVQGSSYELPDFDTVCLVTIGDAFHWMIPRAQALAALDERVVPGGAVALLSHRWPGHPKPSWEPLLNRIRGRHLGPSPSAGPTGQTSRDEAGSHEDIVRGSAFAHLTKITTDYTLDLTVDRLVAWQFSQAQTSLPVLGERRQAFEADLRAALHAWEPSGRFEETSQAHLLLGRRPGELRERP